MRINKKLFLILLSCIFIFTGCSSSYLIKKTAKGLNNYYIEAILDEDDKTLHVTQQIEYTNNCNTNLSNLKFHLYPKAFSEGATNKPVSSLNENKAYPNGKSYGDIEIDSIKISGNDLEFKLEEIDQNILNITLNNELKNDKKIKIDMEYELTLPNINHRFGYGENAINLGNFYPIACVYENGDFIINPYSSNGDPFYSQLSNYLVKITYPKNYVLANTGQKTNTIEDNDQLTTLMKAQAVRDFAIVLSNKFQIKEQKVGSTTIKYYYNKDEKPDTSLNTAVDALKTFNKMIGEYPYETLSVVETNFVHGGMEYPNLVYVSDDLNNYEDYTNVIVHEIAHQWWYGLVGNDAFSTGWLDEGLTEYTTALFYEFNPEYGIKLEDVMGNALTAYTMFVEVYEGIFGTVDTSLTRALDEYKTEPEYVYMAYVKGMLLFDNIRKMIGDRKFFRALKVYFKNNKMKNVTPDILIDSFEKSSNRKLSSLFKPWLDGDVLIKDIS